MAKRAAKTSPGRKKGSVRKLKSLADPSELRKEVQKVRRAARSVDRNKVFDAGCALITRIFDSWPKGCTCGRDENCQACHRIDQALQYWLQLEELDNDLIKKMIPEVQVKRQSRRREPTQRGVADEAPVVTMSDVIRGLQDGKKT